MVAVMVVMVVMLVVAVMVVMVVMVVIVVDHLNSAFLSSNQLRVNLLEFVHLRTLFNNSCQPL